MEPNNFLNLFISVFAGIITSSLIFGFLKVLNKIIIPWYQATVYKGLDISGEWTEHHNYENLITQESKIIIEQNAHTIKGRITLAKKNDNDEIFELKNFRFSGEFYNNFLNINCWNEDKRQIGTHNYLMEIQRDGKEMEGFKTYFDIGFKKIRSEEISWDRTNMNG